MFQGYVGVFLDTCYSKIHGVSLDVNPEKQTPNLGTKLLQNCTWRIIPFSKWLITIVSFRPLRIGLWDPFQMAFLWLLNGGDPNHLRYLG